jgi:hypothetical protein
MASTGSPIADIASAGIQGAFTAAGNKAQAEAAQKALDFEKAQKAKQEVAAAPYLALGKLATGNLPNLAAGGPTVAAPTAYGTHAFSGVSSSLPMSQIARSLPPMSDTTPMSVDTQSPQTQLVMVQAPTGETRRVPVAQAQLYVQRGARIVG